MYCLSCDKKSHLRRSFLCALFIIAVVFCVARDGFEIEKLVYTDVIHCESAFSASDRERNEIVSNEFTGFSVIKNIASKNSAIGRHLRLRAPLDYAVTDALFLLFGVCVLLILRFYRNLVTSHHFIISYIHHLDGMKH